MTVTFRRWEKGLKILDGALDRDQAMIYHPKVYRQVISRVECAMAQGGTVNPNT